MNFKREKLCCFDLEADYERGLDVWSKHYKLESAAFLIVNEHGFQKHYTTDKEEIYYILKRLKEKDYTFIVHNLNYEGGVLIAQMGIDITELSPEGELRAIDTMRLHQHTTKEQGDNRSLSLDSAVKEYTGAGHKGYYIDYLIKKGVARTPKEAHAKVGLLPPEMLKSYNMLDVEVTFDLFNHCKDTLEYLKYDWETDHILYVSDVRRNLKTYIRGIKIDRDAAFNNLLELLEAQKQAEATFHVKYANEIQEALGIMSDRKTQDDLKKRREKATNIEGIKVIPRDVRCFNLNSTYHKAVLAIEVLKYKPYIFTEKGAASFKQGNLHQYGDLGEDLKCISYFSRPILELQKVLAHSEEDGRLHALVRASTTVTGRSTSKRGE